MAITTEILRSYRAPRDVMHRQLAAGVREDRALAYVMAACLVIFVSTLPRIARQASLAPEVPLDARIGGALFGWMILAPLALYVIAAFSHFLARLVGGKGSWYSARMALFWSLLASTPLWLLNGLAEGLIGPGSGQQLVGFVAFMGFLAIWSVSLSAAEAPADTEDAP